MSRPRKAYLSIGVLAITVVAVSTSVPTEASDHDVLRRQVEQLTIAPRPSVEGAPIAATVLIGELYQRRDFTPAWSRPDMVEALYRQVLRSSEHGLNPDDYHAVQLARRMRPDPPATPTFRANTEILCTDALARLVVALRFGKLDPADLEPTWNFSREIEAEDPVRKFNDILDQGDLEGEIDELAPQLDFYRWLQQALADYRTIEARGGWSTIPDGPTLKVGANGPRVAALRSRLLVTGDLGSSDSADPAQFDDELADAVGRFQTRHGLDPDGKVGPRTLAELNVPVAKRIDQIRASLERVRWVFRDIRGDYMLVDIAGYRAYLVEQDEPVWSTRIQVGEPFHETPVFKAEMRYLVFNPTWTVPTGILAKETLPAIREDPEYLEKNNMSVVAADGTVIDPATIDWAEMSIRAFPYMIRQEPGPKNALGQVKFMFPNPYMVYLHDTPSKGIFARADRASSHGCIRVENPLTLADLLLEDDPKWDRARIDDVVASGVTTTVGLPEPLTVMLVYWTARADADGTVYFRRDLYGRDDKLIEHLDEPYRASPPRGAGAALQRR